MDHRFLSHTLALERLCTAGQYNVYQIISKKEDLAFSKYFYPKWLTCTHIEKLEISLVLRVEESAGYSPPPTILVCVRTQTCDLSIPNPTASFHAGPMFYVVWFDLQIAWLVICGWVVQLKGHYVDPIKTAAFWEGSCFGGLKLLTIRYSC